MSLMFKPLRDYATFDGRSRRAEYWLFVLFQILLALVLVLAGAEETILMTAVWLGLIIPNCALGVRRLHDIGLSGWFYLLSLIPIVGGIFMLVCALIPGDKEENRFGAVPA